MYGRKTRKNKHLQAYIYVIACADNHYYVGFTRYLHYRLKCHWLGLGAQFTRAHKPLRLISWIEATGLANEYELWSMFADKYGPKRVGGYTKNLCEKCGFPWHY